MAFPYKYFARIFGENGDNTLVPDDNPGDGNVSYETGFGADYSKDPEDIVDPGKRIDRGNYNSVSGQITQTLKQYQEVGVPAFIDSATNGGSPFPYSRGARCYYPTDGTPSEIYENLVDGNTNPPPNGWKNVGQNLVNISIDGDVTVSASDSPLTYSKESLNMQPASVEGMSACALDTDGNLWISGNSETLGNSGALQKYNVDGENIVYAGITIPLTDFAPGNQTSSGMGIDPDGNLWITNRFDNTAYKYIFGGGTFVFSTSISVIECSTMFIDSNGDMWTGGPDVLYKYNFSSGSYTYAGGGDDVDLIAEFSGARPFGSFLDSENNAWLYDQTGGGIYYKYNFSGTTFNFAGSSYDSAFGSTIAFIGTGNGFLANDGNIWVVDQGVASGSDNSRRYIYKLFSNNTKLSLTGIGILANVGLSLELPDLTIVRCTNVLDDDNIVVSEVISPGVQSGNTRVLVESNDETKILQSGEVVLRKPDLKISLPKFYDDRIHIDGSPIHPVVDYTIANMQPGNYYIDLSYNWSLNATNADFVSTLIIDGVSQGTSGEIQREEPQDNGGNDGDGRGTNQKFCFSQKYYFQVETAKNVPLEFNFSGTGPDPAIWNLVLEVLEAEK